MIYYSIKGLYNWIWWFFNITLYFLYICNKFLLSIIKINDGFKTHTLYIDITIYLNPENNYLILQKSKFWQGIFFNKGNNIYLYESVIIIYRIHSFRVLLILVD